MSFSIDVNKKIGGNKNDDVSDNDNSAATLEDVDRFLQENFRSLYIEGDGGDGGNNDRRIKGNRERSSDRSDYDGDYDQSNRRMTSPRGLLSPRFIKTPPNLRGSRRFFVSAGSTGSLIEEARNSFTATNSDDIGSTSRSTSTSTTNTNIKTPKYDSSSSAALFNDLNPEKVRLPDDSIAVLTYSPSPYDDFRRSMQEMVNAKLRHDANVDWDFMEELLFCYLNLNEKKSYRYILSAFADLVVILRRDSSRAVPVRSRRFRVARERRMRKSRN